MNLITIPWNNFQYFSNLSRRTKLKIARIFFFLSIKLNNDSFNFSFQFFHLLRITISRMHSQEEFDRKIKISSMIVLAKFEKEKKIPRKPFRREAT